MWFRIRFPAEVGTKTFADGNFLTTSVSAGLSKDSGSLILIHTTQGQEQHNNIPYKRFTHWNRDSVRSQRLTLISARMTNSTICCMSEKVFSITYTWPPLWYDRDIKIGSKMEVKLRRLIIIIIIQREYS